MDIIEIKRRVELLKEVTQQRAILIKDVAREIKERQTDLMIFIQDNPSLFHTEPVWSYKEKTYYEPTPFGKVKCRRTEQDKCKGLGITDVYLKAEDNFRTDEYVTLMQKQKAMTIWVSEWNNYGTVEGHYVIEDQQNKKDEHRKHLWRNTAEKIRKLRDMGILTDNTFYIGGAFDCSSYSITTAITSKAAEKARSLGWTVIGI